MKKEEVLKTGKQIITVVVSAGVGMIVANAVKMTTPLNVGVLKKLSIGAGSFVLGSMLSDKATEYTDQTIDKVADQVKEMFDESEEEPKENVEELAEA